MSPEDLAALYNLRSGKLSSDGLCMYIQSHDTGDCDGYLIAAAGHVVQQKTSSLEYVLAVPERRAWRYGEEKDTTKHDYEMAEEIRETAGQLLKRLCPDAKLVRGLLNQRNFLPWRIVFQEPGSYGTLLESSGDKIPVDWMKISDLAVRVMNPEVTSLMLDMNGSMGYLDGLVQYIQFKNIDPYQLLGAKLKASGMPITIMAGVQAELKTMTMPMPGRDPRATMNALYYPDAVPILLRLAKEHSIPLLFVTNNTCNEMLKLNDAADVVEKLGLKGLLERMATVWYGRPHLAGKCVPFDWVSFSAMLLYGRDKSCMTISEQELHVGKDPSVLVLRRKDSPRTVDVDCNLADTELWGTVESVDKIDFEVMLQLSKYAAANMPDVVADGAVQTGDSGEGTAVKEADVALIDDKQKDSNGKGEGWCCIH